MHPTQGTEAVRIGILGGGQLARMLALAGYPLGQEFIILCPAHDACASALGEHICAPFDDHAALRTLAGKSDVITYEFENVPAESVKYLHANNAVYPSPHALMTGRDRLLEKGLFRELGIETARFAPVDDLESLQQAALDIGLPAILKTRTEGYDGKGQYVIREMTELAPALDSIGQKPAILEGFVAFEREVSIVAVRDREGETAFYPLTENVHRDGILRLSTSLDHDPMQALAEDYATRLLERLEYVGVLAIEFFQRGDRLLVNEYAPRVHNSGHWTIEGAETSQFENHLRAISGLPLGSTGPVGKSAMINLIGDLPRDSRVLALPDTHLHRYGKQPRPGRKVGHVTVRARDSQELQQRLKAVQSLLEPVS